MPRFNFFPMETDSLSMKALACISFIYLFGFQAYAETGDKIIIKKNETLSNVLWKLQVIPLYGKKGKIKKILALNPHLRKRNYGGHLVKPGDVVYLGENVSFETTSGYEVTTIPSEIRITREVSSEITVQQSLVKDYALGVSQTYHAYKVEEKTGENGTIATGLTPGIFLEAKFLDSESSKLKFQISYQYLSLLKAKDYEIKNKDFFMSSMSADYAHRITQSSFIHFGLSSDEHLFFAKGVTPSIEVHKTSLRSFQIGFSGKWELDKRHEFKPTIRYSYYPGSSNQGYGFNQGNGFEVRLRLNKAQSFFLEPFYSSYKLHGNDSTYSWDQLGIGFGKEF